MITIDRTSLVIDGEVHDPVDLSWHWTYWPLEWHERANTGLCNDPHG